MKKALFIILFIPLSIIMLILDWFEWLADRFDMFVNKYEQWTFRD